MITLSHFQLTDINPPTQAKSISISIDLSRTQVTATLSPEGITFENGIKISWTEIARIRIDQNACFSITPNGIRKIRYFSELSNRYYSLMPTSGAPTMLISGIPMHRIKDTNPWQDTLEKVKAFGGIHGTLLDTNTGLGYTAIAAAQAADWVMTIEIEPVVLNLCRQNPWSQELFDNPNISPILGDSFEVVASLPNHAFENILHDPPTFSLAGDLYSLGFYTQLFRVLTPDGKLFHYIGNPNSKTGATVTRGVVQRLQKAGFKRILPHPEAFGLLAVKK